MIYDVKLESVARVRAALRVPAVSKEEAERQAMEQARSGIAWKYDGCEPDTISVHSVEMA